VIKMTSAIVRSRKTSSMIRRLRHWKPTPLRIVVIYVVVGALWMLLSNTLVRGLVSDRPLVGYYETFIDWLYVVATAWMLYVLIRRSLAATQQATQALRQSEEQFRQLAEHVREAFWMSAPRQDGFTYMSPVYEDIWGRSRDGLYEGREAWLAGIHPEDRAGVIAALDRRARGEYEQVYRIVRPDGSTRWVQDRAYPIHDERGQVYRICGVMQDVTGQVLATERLERRVEERTREIERRRIVSDTLRDILSVLNSDRSLEEVLDFIVARSGQLLDISTVAIYRTQDGGKPPLIQAGCGLLGDGVAELALPMGQEALERAIAERRPVTMPDAWTIAVTDDSGVAVAGQHDLAQTRQRSGSVLALPLLVKGEVYGGFVTHHATLHQVSEEEIRLAAILADHAALAIENSRLRTQARQAAVTAERSRLARGLHDSVTQALYSMMLYAEATSMAMSAGKQDVAAKNLQELRTIAREAVLDMRILIFELHPPVLEESGLVAALQARLATVEARAGVHAEVDVEGERRLPRPVEEELFWIAREALNNAVKHARATRVTVRLRFGEGDVRMDISDDGQGFDSAGAGRSGGVGLRGIEERVQRIGGRLEIVSLPQEGTTLTVQVKVPGAGRLSQ